MEINNKLFLEDINFLDLLGGRDDIFNDGPFNFLIRFLWIKSQYLHSQKQADRAIECLQYVCYQYSNILFILILI